VQRELPLKIDELRKTNNFHSEHKRIPNNIASLRVGLCYFLKFALNEKAISEEEFEKYTQRFNTALDKVGDEQLGYQEDSDSTQTFLDLLSSALSSGKAHLAGRTTGSEPDNAEALGWHLYNTSYISDGEKIGWTGKDDLYLEPMSAYRVARDLANSCGYSLPANRTIQKGLYEKGLLQSDGMTRQRYTVRRTIQGHLRNVLYLKLSTLLPSELSKVSQLSQLEQKVENNGSNQEIKSDNPLVVGGGSLDDEKCKKPNSVKPPINPTPGPVDDSVSMDYRDQTTF